MNARHLKKKFKKQINKLKFDNALMRQIISNSPTMQELYDLYNKPLNVIHTTIPFREYKVNRVISQDKGKVDHYLDLLKKRKWQVSYLMVSKRTLYILSMIVVIKLQSWQAFLQEERLSMRVEEMTLRSEIRQMLNEAGFNRETIKQLVKDSIDAIVKNQVNQVLMEREEKDLAEVVSDYIDSLLYSQIREKLRWMNFNVNVQAEAKGNKA